jgi:hypothetical protein
MLSKVSQDVEDCGSRPRVVEGVTISLGEATRPPGLITVNITTALGATSYHLILIIFIYTVRIDLVSPSYITHILDRYLMNLWNILQCLKPFTETQLADLKELFQSMRTASGLDTTEHLKALRASSKAAIVLSKSTKSSDTTL